MVKKRDGRLERFRREKLLNGLLRATEKRDIDIEVLNDIAMKIRQTFVEKGATEIESEAIGEEAMKYLKTLDDVAYIRFASVYMDFDSVGQFKSIIDELKKGG